MLSIRFFFCFVYFFCFVSYFVFVCFNSKGVEFRVFVEAVHFYPFPPPVHSGFLTPVTGFTGLIGV